MDFSSSNSASLIEEVEEPDMPELLSITKLIKYSQMDTLFEGLKNNPVFSFFDSKAVEKPVQKDDTYGATVKGWSGYDTT